MAKQTTKKSLKDRAKELTTSLPIMEGREKGEMERLIGGVHTIHGFGFLEDPESGKDYVCFIIAEDPQNFYFGGKVLTENLQELEADGYREEIEQDGIPVTFGKKPTKNGKKEYVTVEFYPE